MHRLLVGAATVSVGLGSVPGFTRITECPCSGAIDQAWIYPETNTTGPIFHVGTGGCWELVSDGCAWDQEYCIELTSSCDGTQWNATRGVEPGTVTFIVASNSSVGGLGLCADWNKDLQLLQMGCVTAECGRGFSSTKSGRACRCILATLRIRTRTRSGRQSLATVFSSTMVAAAFASTRSRVHRVRRRLGMPPPSSLELPNLRLADCCQQRLPWLPSQHPS